MLYMKRCLMWFKRFVGNCADTRSGMWTVMQRGTMRRLRVLLRAQRSVTSQRRRGRSTVSVWTAAATAFSGVWGCLCLLCMFVVRIWFVCACLVCVHACVRECTHFHVYLIRHFPFASLMNLLYDFSNISFIWQIDTFLKHCWKHYDK